METDVECSIGAGRHQRSGELIALCNALLDTQLVQTQHTEVVCVRGAIAGLTKRMPTTGQRRGQLKLERGHVGALHTKMQRKLPGPKPSLV
jgi:hypothetical protein